MKILIVDDNKENLYFLQTLLSGNGFKVVSASNGKEALEKLRADKFDLIISDILMPVMDGFQLCRECNADAELKSIPFVFYTATYTEAKDEELALKMGAERFIRKPADPEEFIKIIRLVIAESEEGKIIHAEPSEEAEEVTFKLYNERLVRKLEKKMLELEASEKKYHRICENINDLVFMLDTEGRFTLANCKTEMLGYTMEDIIGKPFFEFLTPESKEKALGFFNRAKQEPDFRIVYEVEVIKKDGGIAFLELSMSSIIEDGKFAGRFGVARDITERKRAENALQESEERFRMIFERSTVGKSLTTPEGKLLQVNRAFADMLGYTVEEMQTINFAEITHPDDLAISRDSIRSLLANEQTAFRFEKRYIHKNGNIVWTDLSTTLLRDSNGIPLYLITSIVDITVRKQAEEALEVQKVYLEDLFEGAPEAIAILDNDDKVIRINQEFINLFRYTPKEAVGHYINDLVIPDELKDEGKQLSQEVKEGRKISIETIRKDKAGKRINVSIMGKPIKLGKDQLAVYGIYRDITEHKKLEDQFRQAQKMESVGRLAGGVAHDFNNLLTVISGYTELAKMSLDEKDPLYYDINQISEAAKRAADLTRQLLAFSRKQTLEPKIIDLNQIISNMEKIFQRLIGENILLTTELKEDLSKIKADPGQIEQVITNLVVNSRDAMPEGGNMIIATNNISYEEFQAQMKPEFEHIKSDAYVQLSISDTGTGMSEDVRSKIFDPFYTTKEIGKGTGLGLSTVYGIIKQSGGSIWVDSKIGQGTTFSIYMPAVEGEADEIAENISREELPRGKEKILIVEDEENVRKLIVKVLKRLGYKIIEASSGTDAYHICTKLEKPVDLILTDVIMPNMGGYELVDKLRKLWGEIKVLFMSGYTADTIVHQGLIKSKMPYIQKPFSPEKIAQKVRDILDH